jgi:2'-5' RNA ligase
LPFRRRSSTRIGTGQPAHITVAPVPAVGVKRARSWDTSGRSPPAKYHAERIKHDKLGMFGERARVHLPTCGACRQTPQGVSFLGPLTVLMLFRHDLGRHLRVLSG